MLADPFSLGSEIPAWEPPPVLPDSSRLRAVRQELDTGLKAPTPGHMEWCIRKLLMLPSRSATELDKAFQTENFLDACGHYPDDLWTWATTELLRSKTFRPSPAEMVEITEPKYGERQRMLERVNLMLEGAASKPAEVPKYVPTAARDRLRKIFAEQQTKPYADESHRLHDMANTERALAYEEKRPMADWAWQFFADRVDPGERAAGAKRVSEATSARLAELAAAHREGRAASNERAKSYNSDLNTGDIPEAAHGG